jgi:hypothetical protein
MNVFLPAFVMTDEVVTIAAKVLFSNSPAYAEMN